MSGPYREPASQTLVWEAMREDIVYGDRVVTYDTSRWYWLLYVRCWFWTIGRPWCRVCFRRGRIGREAGGG